jgi:hypothetical protein
MTADYGPWGVVAGGSDGVGVLSRRAAVLALSNHAPGAAR